MDEKRYKKNEENINDNLPPTQGKKSGFNLYWLYAILLAILLGMGFWGFKDTTAAINNVQLKQMILQRDVDKIVIITQKQIGKPSGAAFIMYTGIFLCGNIGNNGAKPASDHHHTQRGNKRRKLEPGYEQSVNKTDRCTNQHYNYQAKPKG